MSQRAPSTPDTDLEEPGIRPSRPLTLFVWLAESALVYAILGLLIPYLTPAARFGPLFVFAPYGLAVLTTLLLAAAWGVAFAFAGRFSTRVIRIPPSVSLPLSYVILSVVATGVALLYVAAFVVVLLAVSWSELYGGWDLGDPAWLGALLEDTNGGTERGLALGWLWGLGLLIWWRGSYVTRARVDASGTASRFLLGLVLMVALMVLWGGDASAGRLDLPVLLAAYLLFGLAATAAARLDVTLEGRAGGVDSLWRWRSLVLSLLLVGLGFGVVLLVLPALATLAAWIWDWIVNVLVPALVEVWRWIVNLLGLDRPSEVALPPPGEEEPLPRRVTEPPMMVPEWLARLARDVFVLSWVALIAFTIYASLRHRFRLWGARGVGGATRERVPWSLRSWLLSVLLSLLRLLASRWPSLTRWVSRLAAREQTGWTVRKVYRELLAWGAAQGSARAAWTTPAEYEQLLSARWPDLAPEFRLITERYVEVRYGGAPATEEGLEAVLRGWLRIEGAGAETP